MKLRHLNFQIETDSSADHSRKVPQLGHLYEIGNEHEGHANGSHCHSFHFVQITSKIKGKRREGYKCEKHIERGMFPSLAYL
jgi:hypothetical protein